MNEDNDRLDRLENLINNRIARQSTELNKLYEALSKAQAEIKPVKTNQKNPFFKSDYADLKAVVEVSRAPLTANGLSVIQITEVDDKDRQYLVTRLCHSSGQWIESRLKIQLAKIDIQLLGSHLTYLRRYLYSSLVGIVVTDEDDDGNTASQPEKVESFISTSQEQMIETALKEHQYMRKNFLALLGLSSFQELPKAKFNATYKRILELIEKNKNREEEVK